MAEIIESMDIKEIVSTRFHDYSKYVLLSRAIPNVMDGLKPVQRRILYAMQDSGNTHDKPYRKSAKAVGEVMGNFHPHGDFSIYEALARMSKDWVMPIPLIDMQGNNGSIDGDAPASMRYTEARLSKFVTERMMSGIKKKGLIPMVDNYDDTSKEPTVLPVQVPTILLMGNEGIGIGYSTYFPTFNLQEVVKACILHLENEDVTDEELHQVLIAPDFPTAGLISNGKSLLKVMSEGKGRVTVRSNYEVKQLTKRKKQIIFTDIPYDINKSNLIKELDTIIADKKVNGLLSAIDESGREDSVRIVVEVDDDADLNVVLGYLFKNTLLQTNINLNMVVIYDNKPQVMGVFDIIRVFNKFRKELTLKELSYDLNTLKTRLEIVEGFIKLADIIGEVVQTIRGSDGRADAKQNIMKEYEFTELQAENIVGMALHRLSKTDAKQYLDEEKSLNKNINLLTKIIKSDKLLTEFMIRNYTAILEEYSKTNPRLTKVIPDVEDWTVRAVDVVQEEDTFVGVSKEGYIKRANRRSFNTTSKNGLIEGDEEILVEETTTKQFLMVFLSNGKYVYLPVHDIEDTRWGETGKHLSSYVDIGSNVHVVNAFIVDEENDVDKLILTVKSNGHVKRTPVKEHIVSRYGATYDAIKIVAEEHLIGAYLHDNDKEYFIGFHADNDRTLQFSLNDVLPKGLRTQGMRGIHTDNEKGDSIKEHVVVEDIVQMPNKYHVGNRGTKGKVFKK